MSRSAAALALASGCLLAVLLLSGSAASQMAADETRTHVEVDEDGDAVFHLEVRTLLDTEEERAAFEEFADDVESDPESWLDDFRDDMTRLVERVDAATPRNMTATDFTVEARVESVPRERGIVVYSFRWSGFAVVEDDHVTVDGPLGGYILDEEDSLEITYPGGYGVVEVSPDADSRGSRSVRWDGPRDFHEDEPRLVVAPEGSIEDEATDGEGERASDVETPAEDESFPLAPVVALMLLLTLAAATAYAVRTRNTEEEAGGESEEDALEEAVPDRERVLNLVERADGRIKQKRVVEETGWSEAKVSQVTSELEDDGEIRKLRMGRENVLEALEEEEE